MAFRRGCARRVARLLEDAALVVVASPAYLKRVGAPQKQGDLEQHECIQFDLPSSGRQISWLFNEDGHEKEIFSIGNYACSEDVLGGVTLAKAAAGLFQTYRFIVEKELADGSLVEVLQSFAGRIQPAVSPWPAVALACEGIHRLHDGADRAPAG